AMADEGAQVSNAQRAQPKGGERMVGRGGKVGRRVDQGAVKVEDNGRVLDVEIHGRGVMIARVWGLSPRLSAGVGGRAAFLHVCAHVFPRLARMMSQAALICLVRSSRKFRSAAPSA